MPRERHGFWHRPSPRFPELGAHALEMDVTEEADIVAAVDRITAERGGIDVLVVAVLVVAVPGTWQVS